MTGLKIATGIVAILAISIYVMRVPALEGRLGETLRGLYQLLWPTTDLWKPLVDEPIDVSVAGSEVSRELSITYPGQYALGLRVERRIPNPVPTDQPTPRIQVTFLNGGKRLSSFEIGSELRYPWWDGARNGFQMVYFEVPRDLPPHAKLSLEATIVTPSDAFVSQNGATSLFFRKNDTK